MNVYYIMYVSCNVLHLEQKGYCQMYPNDIDMDVLDCILRDENKMILYENGSSSGVIL